MFPGGNFDAKQDSSLEMTAIRETFEESGLLIASSSDLSSDSSGLEDYLLDEERKSIHAQQTNFETFLSEHHLTADVSSLLPFTTWVTPSSAPRSVFFLTSNRYLPLISKIQAFPCSVLCNIYSSVIFKRILSGRQVGTGPNSRRRSRSHVGSFPPSRCRDPSFSRRQNPIDASSILHLVHSL